MTIRRNPVIIFTVICFGLYAYSDNKYQTYQTVTAKAVKVTSASLFLATKRDMFPSLSAVAPKARTKRLSWGMYSFFVFITHALLNEFMCFT
jgi:hypothetical protein